MDDEDLALAEKRSAVLVQSAGESDEDISQDDAEDVSNVALRKRRGRDKKPRLSRSPSSWSEFLKAQCGANFDVKTASAAYKRLTAEDKAELRLKALAGPTATPSSITTTAEFRSIRSRFEALITEAKERGVESCVMLAHESAGQSMLYSSALIHDVLQTMGIDSKVSTQMQANLANVRDISRKDLVTVVKETFRRLWRNATGKSIVPYKGSHGNIFYLGSDAWRLEGVPSDIDLRNGPEKIATTQLRKLWCLRDEAKFVLVDEDELQETENTENGATDRDCQEGNSSRDDALSPSPSGADITPCGDSSS